MNKMTRVSNLTAEQRVERGKNAVKVRWENDAINGGTLKAKYTGELKIGDLTIPCAVLEDGRRVLSETGMSKILGNRTGAARRLSQQNSEEGKAHLPVFLAQKQLEPYIGNSLGSGPLKVIKYRMGRSIYSGYPAEILPIVCDIWLTAREANKLSEINIERAKKAETIIRALAKVGITALVDEATGYQEERDKTELQKLLSKYIQEEYLPWQARFPKIFYKELFRLFGWKFDPSSVKRPALLGKFTNDYVYSQLPQGVLEDLKAKNPPDDNGNRKQRHHQFLTSEVGVPHLDKHLTGLILLMKASDDIIEFKKLYERTLKNDDDKTITVG